MNRNQKLITSARAIRVVTRRDVPASMLNNNVLLNTAAVCVSRPKVEK
jgi:hypothetical protein